ncbi:unnamed protein product [Linum tenue]|uniref:NAC domain-containing protein n=1 Tax=Linum tenue TaxID=586396 RepID=A0AAV0JIQ6_9ROSI|nr:unnamed protein product [Linum tenue]
MMSNISMVEGKLPPGFRFHPRDEELVCDYLMKKISSSDSDSFFFIEVDLNKCEPWDLPGSACVGGKEWYLYSQRDRKYATGLRTNRATASGYWKATGKDMPIVRTKAAAAVGGGQQQQLVGMRKTLVFYQGRAPKGTKTDWVMHEFRVQPTLSPPRRSAASHKEDWVLCRVFYKNRDQATNIGPKGMATRNNMISYDDDDDDDYLDTDNNNSSSLPPLMDSSYNINFDQQQQTAHEEQVPCFSMFSSHNNAPPPPSNSLFPQFFYNPLGSTADHQQQVLSVVPPPPISLEEETFSTCDQKVIKAVLSHLTKVENANDIITSYPYVVKDSSCLSLGQGSSVESYLSDVGIPNLWNPY